MKKSKLHKCFGCFCGYTKCDPSINRISRKSKKTLKKFTSIIFPFTGNSIFRDDISSCDLKTPYKFYKKCFWLIDFVTYHKKEIEFIFNALEENSVYLNFKGQLCWYWEHDDDYCPTSGLMPFCYSKEQAGKTWAYSEMNELWYNLYKGHKGESLPEFIKSDKDFLNYIKKNPIPKQWIDE